MECDVARQLLAFRRPGELPADEIAALDRHLAGCPQCAAAAHRQEAFDSAVAAAVKKVPVPPGLRDRLLTDALAHRGALLRRKVAESLVWVAFGFTTLAFGTGVYTALALEDLRTDAIAESYAGRMESNEQTVRSWLADQGLPPTLPRDFDFTLYKWHGEGELQGRKGVPVVRFETVRPGNQQPDFAEVYVVRGSRFRWSRPKPAQNSFVTVQVFEDRDVAYVVVHTAPLDQFLRPPLPRV